MLPDQIGRYTILELLGQGRMGQVYRAHDPDLNREVALKLITPADQVSINEEWRQRFRREAQAVARLNHPHIVTIYDVNLKHDPPYVVMELLRGGSLKERLKQKRLSWSEGLTLLRPLGQALAYAHRVGVIHRDVKPANVMFGEAETLSLPDREGRSSLKLVDFGLARQQDWQQVTHTGSVFGTPNYMSPEQARGEVVDGRTDIFALGVMLFEAITGYNPLDRGSAISTLFATISDAPVDLSRLTGKAPPAVIHLIERAIVKNREQRYPTGEELLADLDRCLADRPDGQTGMARASLSTRPSTGSPTGPTIQKAPEINLTPEIETILRSMFNEFSRIAIEAEFSQGLGGGRVFRVRPIETGDQAHLPAVVKIAPIELIRQEWQAYQTWVAHILPGVARLEASPSLPPGSLWDGLRYGLVGGGAFEVQSLYSFCQQAKVEDLWWVLTERLYQTIGVHWWLERHLDRAFQMQTDYDSVLPINLLVRPADAPTGVNVHRVTPEQLPPPLAKGDTVRLEGFVVTEIDPDRGQVTLNLSPTRPNLPPAAYRLRLVEVNNLDRYRVGQIIDYLTGLVTVTRHDLLVGQASQALGETVDLSAEHLPVSPPRPPKGGRGSEPLPVSPSPGLPAHPFASEDAHSSVPTLPNPLLAYQDMLHAFLTVNISTIHGDLNLENILIDPKTRHINLIDFATVRQGHCLRDLLRLETEVVTKLISAALAEANLPAVAIQTIYQQLHLARFQPNSVAMFEQFPPALEKPLVMLAAIRKMARNCLFNPDDWTEYYQGLTLYLLGALKFKNLDRWAIAPLPKQVAFWGAAATTQLLIQPPPEAVTVVRPPITRHGEAVFGPAEASTPAIDVSGADVPSEQFRPATRPQTAQGVVAGGDVVQGEKIEGDQINVGHIFGHGVAIGRQPRVTVSQGIGGDEVARLFEAAYRQIEARPEDPDVDKEELIELVTKIQQEVVKGEQANANKVKRWLDNLAGMAPDISRTTVAGLIQPGVPPPIRQIAAKAGPETE